MPIAIDGIPVKTSALYRNAPAKRVCFRAR